MVTRTPGMQARARMLEASTSSSLSATRRRADALSATGRYTDPVSRQAALAESMREQKAAESVDVDELEAQYGREGAVHMQHVLMLQRARAAAGKSAVPLRRRPLPASKEDLSSVAALEAWEAAAASMAAAGGEAMSRTGSSLEAEADA